MKKVWYVTGDVRKDVEVVKSYTYKKQAWYKLNVDGKIVKALQSDCEPVKYVKMKKPVYGHIQEADKFDRECLAEIYGMVKNGRCEFIKGYIAIEIRKYRGVDFYTVWRETADHENYDVEIDSTNDIDLVVRYLTMINNYEFAGWYKTFEELQAIRDNASDWYGEILADPFVA